MKKQLKDYLHLYLGCDVEYPDTDDKLVRSVLTGYSIKEGAETTHKRKRNGCKGDLICFKDGKELLGNKSNVTNGFSLSFPGNSMESNLGTNSTYQFIQFVRYVNIPGGVRFIPFNFHIKILSGCDVESCE